MRKIHYHAAGIDIGSRKVFVAIEGKEVVNFETFTADLKLLIAYLKQHNITTVAMEATGVYWIILYDMLEECNIDVWLVDGRQTKQVPGRKTDVKDCQWIQQLHSYGLLNRCHVNEGKRRELRGYLRIREDHIQSAAMHVNHMHKSLIQMNIRLPEVLSQVHGKSGMAMISVILQGERDKHVLLSLCHTKVRKNKEEMILKALDGHYREEHLFALRQAYEAYFFYQQQIAECDRQIEKVLQEINDEKEDHPIESPRKPIRHHKPEVTDLGQHMLKAFDGHDATVLPGITDYTLLQLLAETGTDLSKWKTEKHFTSWLGLSPGQHHSGKMKRNRVRKGKPKAGQIFRLIAHSLINSKKIALGAFGRRLRSRKGPAIAIKAMARKLACMFWRLMVKGSDYVEKGVATYEAILKQHKIKYINKLALELDMELSPAN